MIIYCHESCKYALKRDYCYHIDLRILAISIEEVSVSVLVNDPRRHICFWVSHHELITMDEFNGVPVNKRRPPLEKFYSKSQDGTNGPIEKIKRDDKSWVRSLLNKWKNKKRGRGK